MSDAGGVTDAKTFWDEVAFWSTTVLGTVATSFGLISLAQHFFGIQLIPVYAHGLALYRELGHRVVGELYAPFIWLAQYVSLTWYHLPFELSIPGWWKDMATVSMAFAAVDVRAKKILKRASRKPFTIQSPLLRTVFDSFVVMFNGITLIGLWTAKERIGGLIWPSKRPESLTMAILFAQRAGVKFEEFDEEAWREIAAETFRRVDRRTNLAFVLSLLAALVGGLVFFASNAYPM